MTLPKYCGKINLDHVMSQFYHLEEDRQMKTDVNNLFFYDNKNKKGLCFDGKEKIFMQFSSNWCHDNPCIFIGYGHHKSKLHWLKINF